MDLNFFQIWEIITSAVTLGAAIATVTPTEVDNHWTQRILNIINLIGLNIGKAKNSDTHSY